MSPHPVLDTSANSSSDGEVVSSFLRKRNCSVRTIFCNAKKTRQKPERESKPVPMPMPYVSTMTKGGGGVQQYSSSNRNEEENSKTPK